MFECSYIKKSKINPNNGTYFISNDDIDDNFDATIVKYLGLSLKEYQNILINKFNGILYNSNSWKSRWDIYFENELDCQNAVNYLNENLDKFLVTKELIK